MFADQDKTKKEFSFSEPAVPERKYEFNINLEEMSQAGLQFGHKLSNCHPKMKPYFQGIRGGINVFNLEKTAEKLEEALKYVKTLLMENKTVLLVGTKVQARELTREAGITCNLPYVENRWLGGTFTNFETMKKRVVKLKELEAKKASGELEKYTKKEQAKFAKKIADLQTKFGGVKNMDRIPDAVFILDIKKDLIAVKEARARKVKVIGVCDANVDPALADYPIPANDDAVSSVRYIVEKIKEAAKK